MDIKTLLQDTKTVAIVGLSNKPSKASYGVAQYLMPFYRIIPVNPNHKEILGFTCYPNLESITEPVDMVDVFQLSENILPLVKPAIALNVKSFWMQLGITNREARLELEAAGIEVVEDKCTKIEHAFYR